MLGLGQLLQNARVARDLTLDDVAAKIHLRTAYLAALEAERWEELNDPVYVRGFLRTYAHFLDLNAEQFIAQFNTVAWQGQKLLGPDSELPTLAAPSRNVIVGSLLSLVILCVCGFGAGAAWSHYSQQTASSAQPATSVPLVELSPLLSLNPNASAAPALHPASPTFTIKQSSLMASTPQR